MKKAPRPEATIVTPCAGVWIEISFLELLVPQVGVTPCAGVWIEIGILYSQGISSAVTPCAGVWIEIIAPSKIFLISPSLPVRECGLKSTSRLLNGMDQ